MRKLIAFNMVTLDGFVAGPAHDISWMNTDDAFNQFSIEHTRSAGAIVFGRVTYEGMAEYWPTPEAQESDPEVAHLMNTLPKIVFSKTLQKADWNNTRLIQGDAREEVLKLKQAPGNDLVIFGSANLVSNLMKLDLVDEHRLMINPVIIGRGTPLFKDLDPRVNLKLLYTRTFGNGNVLLYYAPNKQSN